MTTQGHAAAMRQCIADSCLQGGACSTPMKCSGAAPLVDESIDHFRLHRLQNVEAIESRWTEPRPSRYSFAPGVIQGPDLEDFLKKDNALSAIALWVVRPLFVGACIGATLYFAGRAVGLF